MPSTNSTPRLSRARDRGHRLGHVFGITGAIGALKGPRTGGANEFAFDVSPLRYADEAEAAIIKRVGTSRSSSALRHPVYTDFGSRKQSDK
jgi:citrate synthase